MMMYCQQDAGQNNNIKTANKLMENVARLKYLGKALTNQNYVDKEIKSTLNEEIPACYHLAQYILSSLLPKNLEFKMYRTIICLDVHGSVHHNTNRIETTNKMQSCSRIYYSIVSQLLNMFRATHRSSSGAQNCNHSLWFYIRLWLPAAVMAQP
jgi:hypothetical protein